jgi:hypothetical protein
MTTHDAGPILPPHVLDGHATTPEERLMRAVLDDALSVLLDPRPLGQHGRALRVDTERWLLENDVAWPFSFVNVCRALAVDAASVRQSMADRLDHRDHFQPAA